MPLLIVLVISNIVGRIIRRKSLLNLKAYSELSDFVQEDYMGIGVIKAFVKEKLKLKQFEKYNQKIWIHALPLLKIISLSMF